MKRESYEEVMRNGLHATKLLELLPDAEELIIVVRDVRSGTVGTVSIPLGRFLDTAPAPCAFL